MSPAINEKNLEEINGRGSFSVWDRNVTMMVARVDV